MSDSHEQTPLLGSSTASQPSQPSQPSKPSKPSKITPKQPPKFADDDTDDNLTKFRKAIGINANVDETGVDLESARKGARGLYKEIIDIQKWRNRQYILIEILYYVALVTQIIIGATLTALGPVSGLHSKAITILGVVNTSTAGVLAILKGQGLPDRLRKDEFEMHKVQDFIEETESRLIVGGPGTLDKEQLDELLQQVFAKYNAARDTAEANRPDTVGIWIRFPSKKAVY
jgi:hypothetical protein